MPMTAASWLAWSSQTSAGMPGVSVPKKSKITAADPLASDVIATSSLRDSLAGPPDRVVTGPKTRKITGGIAERYGRHTSMRGALTDLANRRLADVVQARLAEEARHA